MIQIIKGDRNTCEAFIAQLKTRDEEKGRRVDSAVAEILAAVRKDGDAAVRQYTKQFDGVELGALELPQEEVRRLAEASAPELRQAIAHAAENIRAFHERQKQQSWFETRADGVMVGQRVRGLKRAGIYVPGGTAAYPSSVLMNAIPAKIAGVEEVVMVTPPSKDGGINPDILAAAVAAGVDRVFCIGGAQAAAALAYGTASVPKVDKIVGPGNIYVATAKKQLYGVVDIDMIAGPSEILILADETADPRYLAADLMSQAEHDVLASAILLTTSERLAEETDREIARQIAGLSRKEMIEASLSGFGAAIVCDSIDVALDFANTLAPEHAEICTKNPMELLGRLDNAGSVFLGNYSPEPIGDYYAGPNHVLPTGGTARFFSPLSVDSFVKKSGFIYYTQDALMAAKSDVITLANAEGLTAHANAIAVRAEELECMR